MQLPGTDLNDPKVRSGAQSVATRRNNAARKKLEAERAKLPLFSDQLPTSESLPIDTAEQVIERRKICQQFSWENGSERDIAEVEKITRLKNELFSQVSQAEYISFYARSLDYSFPQWAFWGIALEKIKRRQDSVPENAALVLAWLENWEREAPTAQELHQACGDGLSLSDVMNALFWLADRDFVIGGVIRACSLSSTGSGVPWRINPVAQGQQEGTDA